MKKLIPILVLAMAFGLYGIDIAYAKNDKIKEQKEEKVKEEKENIKTAKIPEPATLLLVTSGLLGLGLAQRKKS